MRYRPDTTNKLEIALNEKELQNRLYYWIRSKHRRGIARHLGATGFNIILNESDDQEATYGVAH